MARWLPSDGEAVEFVLYVLKDDLIAPHDGGGSSRNGASELFRALNGGLEHAQACEVEVLWPVIKSLRNRAA